MACGSWQSDDQLFLRFEKSLVSRLIGWYRPTDRAELLPFFCLKNEKIFLAKMRAMKKIFCGSKNFFGGEFLVKPKRGLALWLPARAF